MSALEVKVCLHSGELTQAKNGQCYHPMRTEAGSVGEVYSCLAHPTGRVWPKSSPR